MSASVGRRVEAIHLFHMIIVGVGYKLYML